jgi:hypothetical protein
LYLARSLLVQSRPVSTIARGGAASTTAEDAGDAEEGEGEEAVVGVVDAEDEADEGWLAISPSVTGCCLRVVEAVR